MAKNLYLIFVLFFILLMGCSKVDVTEKLNNNIDCDNFTLFSSKYDPNMIEFCDQCTPLSTGGDPPFYISKAYCYCMTADRLEQENYTKATEICKLIDNFKDDSTCCSTTQDCLKQLNSTFVCVS